MKKGILLFIQWVAFWCYDQTKNWITGFENHCVTKWDITLLKHCTKICFNPLCLRLRASPNYWFHCGIVTLCLYFGDLSIFQRISFVPILRAMWIAEHKSTDTMGWNRSWSDILLFYQTVFCWYIPLGINIL